MHRWKTNQQIAASLDRIERQLAHIRWRLHKMAVNQAQFNQALSEFVADLDAGIDQILAKIDALEGITEADFTDELATLTAAKERFTAAVADATDGPDVEPEPEPPLEEQPVG